MMCGREYRYRRGRLWDMGELPEIPPLLVQGSGSVGRREYHKQTSAPQVTPARARKAQKEIDVMLGLQASAAMFR